MNENTLNEPLSNMTLSESETAFLLNRQDPRRNEMVQKAIDGTLATMREHAEVKVPRFLSLDGAAIPSVITDAEDKQKLLVQCFQSENRAESQLTFCKINPQKERLPVEYEFHTVAKDTRSAHSTETTQGVNLL